MSSNSSVSFNSNALELFTHMNNSEFQRHLKNGELVAWDQNEGKFVFCTKNWFGRFVDSLFSTDQNTNVLTIAKKISEFATSTEGSNAVKGLDASQIKAMNKNLVDLALKMGRCKEFIAPLKEELNIPIMTGGLYSKERFVNVSTNYNVKTILVAKFNLNVPLEHRKREEKYLELKRVLG